MDDISRVRKAVTFYGPQSHYTKEILIGTARHYGNWAPEDWKIVVRSLLREGEYLQFQVWYNDLCIEKERQNVQSGPSN